MGTLLVIDDSASTRKRLLDILRKEEVFRNFLEAPDGIAGLKILNDKKSTVDVIACDLSMPKMDGFQFLRLVKTNNALGSIPIVVVTSQSDVSEVVKAFELGANDFIVKPFNRDILKVRLRNMLHIKRLQDELITKKEQMEEMAITDPLTGIFNRRYFQQSVEDEYKRAVRYEDCFSLFIADLDHFKAINDNFGHPRGDAVLKEIADILNRSTRKVDLAARYGGEEFVVLMPHMDTEGSIRAAERFRRLVESNHFEGLSNSGALTVSIGLTTFRPGMDMDVIGLVEETDKALYRAKRGGRNRVEIADCSSGQIKPDER